MTLCAKRLLQSGENDCIIKSSVARNKTAGNKNNRTEGCPMDEREVILEAMRKAGEPLGAGKVAELTGLDRKVVDKAFAALKKDGAIVSPVRCKWTVA